MATQSPNIVSCLRKPSPRHTIPVDPGGGQVASKENVSPQVSSSLHSRHPFDIIHNFRDGGRRGKRVHCYRLGPPNLPPPRGPTGSQHPTFSFKAFTSHPGYEQSRVKTKNKPHDVDKEEYFTTPGEKKNQAVVFCVLFHETC